MHTECLRLRAEITRQRAIDDVLTAEQKEKMAAMENLFKVALHLCRRYCSFIEYEHLLFLLHECGGAVGQREHGRDTAREMIDVAGMVGIEQLRRFFTTVDAKFSFLPHVGVMADKVTDIATMQWEIVNVRFNWRGRPVTVNLALLPLGEGEYLVDTVGDVPQAEAGGYACFNFLLEGTRDDWDCVD